MKSSERQAMARKLKRLGYSDYFEEEAADPYQTSVMRLRKAGFEVF
jgi:hypothetical protein